MVHTADEAEDEKGHQDQNQDPPRDPLSSPMGRPGSRWPCVPVSQGLAGSWWRMEMRAGAHPGRCCPGVFQTAVVPGCREDFNCAMMASSQGPSCCWAVWDLANMIVF